jgi:hypothetical protein
MRGASCGLTLREMTLPIAVATATIPTMGLILVVVFLVRRLGSDYQLLPVTIDWLRELSSDRYRPMLRLLDATDFQFLRAQQGFTPEMERRMRCQRVQAFRGYLLLLVADFDRIVAALHVILEQSAQDRPELASLVLQRRLSFALGLIEVHCRLALFGLGWSRVDVSGLIQLFDGMRLDLHKLVPASSPTAA